MVTYLNSALPTYTNKSLNKVNEPNSNSYSIYSPFTTDYRVFNFTQKIRAECENAICN